MLALHASRSAPAPILTVVSYPTFRIAPIAFWSVVLVLLFVLLELLILFISSSFSLCSFLLVSPFLFRLRNHPLARAKAMAVIGSAATIGMGRASKPHPSANSLKLIIREEGSECNYKSMKIKKLF